MDGEFQWVADAATAELVQGALAQVLERHGFQRMLHVREMGGGWVSEYRKGDDLISMDSKHEAEGQRRLVLRSERIAVSDLAAEAVELAALTLLRGVLEPLLPGGKELGPALQRRLRRLVQDARGGRLEG